MWLSKKKCKELENKIVALEVQVQELQQNKCSIDDISSSLERTFNNINHRDTHL